MTSPSHTANFDTPPGQPRDAHSGVLFAIFAMLLLGAGESAAQALPNAGQLLNEQQRTLPAAPPFHSPPPAVVAPEGPANNFPAIGLEVRVRSVRFTGATALAESSDLASLTTPLIGRTVNHAELQRTVEAATRLLRSRGYMLARAYLPQQDLTDGDLEIAVSEGRLQSDAQRIEIRGTTRIDASRLYAIADSALPGGQALSVEDLERALLLMNDLSGLAARSTLQRGSERGTSRLVVDASDTPMLEGRAWSDNFGNRSTGSFRLGAQLQVNSPSRLGDSVAVGLVQSTGSTAANLNYSLPLNASGLRLNAGASYLRYRIDQEAFRSLDLRGDATAFQLGASYPLVRTRERNLYASLTYERRKLTDRALGETLRSRKLDSLSFLLAGSRIDPWGGGGTLQGNVAVTAGRADLSGNADDKFVDSRTARTNGSFRKLFVGANRLQNLGGAPGSEWTLFAGVVGQLASGNLDSSEKFILGGASGVRAYPVGEASGDEGVLGTLELRRNFALGGDGMQSKLQALAFVDAGQVRLHKRAWPNAISNAGDTNNVHLASAGVGLNLSLDRWTLRTAIARTLGSNPGRGPNGLDADSRSSKWRGWVQAMYAF